MNDTNSHHDRAETIRRGMLWASGDHEKTSLAKAINCPRTRFSTFLSGKGDLSLGQMHNAEMWLRDNNYWLNVATASEAREASLVIADELEALVTVLRARELPEEYKASRLASWVTDAHGNLNIAKGGEKD